MGGPHHVRDRRILALPSQVRLWSAMLGVLTAVSLVPVVAHASVMAWGSNTDGQLGSESLSSSVAPIAVSGLGEVKEVVASNNYSLALLADGQVMAWGSDRRGTLGDGEDSGQTSLPVFVSGLSDVTAVSSTHGYSLALLADGEVMAWGDDKDGRLGNGRTGPAGNTDIPEPVIGLSEVTAISAGQFHALALLRNGTVMAWGRNARGALGDGTAVSSDVPVPVEGVSEAIAVAAGNVHSLVLLRNGTVVAFGASEFGQLGDGHRGPSYVPVPVEGLSNVTAISAGAWQNLALLSNGTVMAWGWNKSGELGDGTRAGPERCGRWGCSKIPIPVSALHEIVAISAASNTNTAGRNVNNLALRANGTVMAWGGNEDGQLGDGTKASSYTPVEVEDLAGVTAISAGGRHSLAIVG